VAKVRDGNRAMKSAYELTTQSAPAMRNSSGWKLVVSPTTLHCAAFAARIPCG